MSFVLMFTDISILFHDFISLFHYFISLIYFRYMEWQEIVNRCMDNFHDKDFVQRMQHGDNPLAELMGGMDDALSSLKRMSLANNALNIFRE